MKIKNKGFWNFLKNWIIDCTPVSKRKFRRVNEQYLKTFQDFQEVFEGFEEFELMIRGDLRQLYDYVIAQKQQQDSCKCKKKDKNGDRYGDMFG